MIEKMQSCSLFKVDTKLKWFGYGEWLEEDDFVTFRYKDFKCRISRFVFLQNNENPYGGFLSGWFELSKLHPLYKASPEELNSKFSTDLTIHKFYQDEYWVGFECAGEDDLIPSIYKDMKKNESHYLHSLEDWYKPTYKNIKYCLRELLNNIDQLGYI